MPSAAVDAAYSLLQLDAVQLQQIADGGVPPAFAQRAADGALPPHFVAARSLKGVAEGQAAQWCHAFVMVRHGDQRIVGACGFKGAPQGGRVEIGYGVSPAHRRQGAASAAVAALLQRAFSGGAAEVLAEVEPWNLASMAVVRRAGFEAIGSRVDEQGDEVMQWRVLNGPTR
jgi:[ribosomal protein S5]-alanine N-acetyltransferase